MNIAFVNATKSWGGVKSWTLDFASELQQCHNLSLYARQPEFVTASQQRLKIGQRVDFGLDFNPKTIRFFYQEFKRQQTDIIIINVGKDLTTAAIAAKLLNIPVVQRIGLPHDIRLSLKTKLIHQWIKPHFLCPCQFIAQGFMANLPYVAPTQVQVILNGKALSPSPLITHTPRQLVCTQQLNVDKGHAILFQALAQISQDFILHLYGTGHEEANLKQLAQNLGLQNKLVWHGFDAQVTQKLPQYDIFLLASLSEGLPNTLLEALAAGLLPICRQVGGVAEVYPKDLAPWLLPETATAKDFQTALEQALSLTNAQLLTQKKAAQIACEQNCHLPKQAQELELWLKELVRGK